MAEFGTCHSGLDQGRVGGAWAHVRQQVFQLDTTGRKVAQLIPGAPHVDNTRGPSSDVASRFVGCSEFAAALRNANNITFS